jgi:hypothetical protein
MRARGFVAVLLAVALVGGRAEAQTTEGRLELRLSGEELPFNQMVRVGPAFIVKGVDYNPIWPRHGIRTAWLSVPEQNGRLELRTRYCLVALAQAAPDTFLQRIDIADGERVLVSLRDGLGALVTEDEILAQIDYEDVSNDTARQIASGSFAYPPRYLTNFPFPTYHPVENCASDHAGFDLRAVASQLAELPQRTLTLRLHFSNGLVNILGINGRTIAEVQKMLTLRQVELDQAAVEADEEEEFTNGALRGSDR